MLGEFQEIVTGLDADQIYNKNSDNRYEKEFFHDIFSFLRIYRKNKSVMQSKSSVNLLGRTLNCFKSLGIKQ